MGKPSAPAPADPRVTAGAQTAQNIGTAIAQQQLNNINQVTPYGNLTYEQTGSYEYTDPNSGETYDIPTYTATQSLSKGQQRILRENERAQQNLATLGADQSARLGDLLSRPVDTTGLPQRGDAAALRGPNFQRVGSGPRLQTGLGNVGGVQRGIANAGSVQRSVGGTTGMRFDIPGAGAVGTLGAGPRLGQNIANAGSVQRGISAVPSVNSNIGDAGQLTREIGDAGDITRSYGTDFSQDRQRVEDALMSRLNPSLQKDRSALEARLASQGIRIGSEAYQSAMDDFGRQSNDARMSAILGAGQEQSRLTGLEAQRAGFENAAQQQAFGQQANHASFANDAQSRQFAQNAQRAQFSNSAQQQIYGQAMGRADLANRAQAQQFGQNAQRLDTANAARQQEFQNAATRTNTNNAAQAQRFGQNAQAAQFRNTAQAQQFGQQMDRADFANRAQAQQFGQNAQAAQFGNAAQQQAFTQEAARAGFRNEALQQQYQNRVGATQANNSMEQQRFNAGLSRLNAMDQARNQALQEQFAVRNQPINEITALMSGSQVSSPNFVNTNPAQLANTDFAGIQANYDNQRMNQYNAQMAQWNSMFGGLAGLGGSLIMASDRRVKTDVTKLGKTEDGLGIYKYRYKGSDRPQIGLMAQEVEKKKPDAVVEVNGLKMVNYDRALGGAA